MRKAGVAALMTLAFAALALPSAAQASAYVSGQVVIQSPVAVFGFSYGNPFPVGHVHYGPAYCDHGPLYYYPAYRVYGHYHPGYAYTRYAAPRYYAAGPYGPRYYGPRYHGPHNGYQGYRRSASWHGHGNGNGHGHGNGNGHRNGKGNGHGHGNGNGHGNGQGRSRH